jgi:hypothetical protein
MATKIEGFFVQGRRSSAPRDHSGELTGSLLLELDVCPNDSPTSYRGRDQD